MGDIEAAERERQRELEAERMRKRSEALKRELPRPRTVNTKLKSVCRDELQAANEMIR